MKNKLFLLPLTAIIALMISCKPTSKNELNKYNNYQKSIKTFAVRYPAFKSQLFIVAESAKKVMNEATKITDEEKKALKMVEANKVFSNNDLYSQLSSYDGRVERIKNKIEKLLNRTTKRIYEYRINRAVDAANAKLKEAAAIITWAKPTSDIEAYEKVKEANGILISAESAFDRVKKLVTKKSTSTTTSTTKKKSWK